IRYLLGVLLFALLSACGDDLSPSPVLEEEQARLQAIADSIAREIAIQDSIAYVRLQDSLIEAAKQDSIIRDSIVRDSLLQDSILQVEKREAFVKDSITKDSLKQDSIRQVYALQDSLLALDMDVAEVSISPRRVGPVGQYGEMKAGVNAEGHGRIYGSCPAYSTSGNEVQVRGMSLYWSLIENGTDFYNDEKITWMVDSMHIELIRAAMGVDLNWGRGNYFTDTAKYRRFMDSTIVSAIQNDIYVIVDYHSHKAHLDPKSSMLFFEYAAQKWGAYDNVIFEIYNEPTDARWDAIKLYAETVIPVIRKYSDNMVIVGSPAWDQTPDLFVKTPVEGENISYSFHYYAGTHKISNQGVRAEKAMAGGLSVIVSEWGTINADGDGDVSDRNSEWQEWVDRYQLSSANWSASCVPEGASAFESRNMELTASGQWLADSVFAKNPTSYVKCE
ncbi:MAG: glycoside hydrolase family 5 protein, partial [Fibrobacter sp.]|nr:glycoside hydrolase family 5 protein [Fibrobacter sp.]